MRLWPGLSSIRIRIAEEEGTRESATYSWPCVKTGFGKWRPHPERDHTDGLCADLTGKNPVFKVENICIDSECVSVNVIDVKISLAKSPLILLKVQHTQTQNT